MHVLNAIVLTVLSLAALLPLNSDSPDTIDIPSIDLSAPVSVADRIVADSGKRTWTVPCSKSASSMQRGGNTSIFGHRDVCGGVFDDIYKLEAGDAIRYAGKAYTVTERHFVEPSETWPIADHGDERITLVSCWPPGATTHRVIIVAIRDEAPAPAPDTLLVSADPPDAPAHVPDEQAPDETPEAAQEEREEDREEAPKHAYTSFWRYLYIAI